MLLQQCSSEGGNKSLKFVRDLCALVSANEKLKNLLEVNCDCSILDESTLRKNYLSKCYNNILEMIMNKVHGKIFSFPLMRPVIQKFTMWQTSLEPWKLINQVKCFCF
jgi:hypothetical protein